jgi:hypothetical protein
MTFGASRRIRMAQRIEREAHHERRPDIPEESNPRRHDALPDPPMASESVSSGDTAPAPLGERALEESPSKVDDAKFLSDEFDISERDAALLVSGTGEDDADLLAAVVREKRGTDDPLADVPTPKEDTANLTTDADEKMLKPVLHHKNQRAGAG